MALIWTGKVNSDWENPENWKVDTVDRIKIDFSTCSCECRVYSLPIKPKTAFTIRGWRRYRARLKKTYKKLLSGSPTAFSNNGGDASVTWVT